MLEIFVKIKKSQPIMLLIYIGLVILGLICILSFDQLHIAKVLSILVEIGFATVIVLMYYKKNEKGFRYLSIAYFSYFVLMNLFKLIAPFANDVNSEDIVYFFVQLLLIGSGITYFLNKLSNKDTANASCMLFTLIAIFEVALVAFSIFELFSHWGIKVALLNVISSSYVLFLPLYLFFGLFIVNDSLQLEEKSKKNKKN